MSKESDHENNLMDSYAYNPDNPEHEFLLSQIIRSSSPDKDPSAQSFRKRKVYQETDPLEFTMLPSLQKSSYVTSEQSLKDTYELQLIKLQETLEATMIENTKLREMVGEGRIRASTAFDIPASDIRAKTVEVQSGDLLFENIVCKNSGNASREGGKEEQPIGKLSRAKDLYRRYRESLYSRFWNFLNDFHTEENEDSVELQKEESFAPSLLSDNIGRLTKALKPYTNAGKSIERIVNWNRRAETLVILCLYMISAYTGYTLQLILIFMVWRLSVSYIIATGLASRFGLFGEEEEEPQEKEPLKLLDKIAMARVILLKVQTITGSVADGLEKVNNLIGWRNPEVTMRLYKFLWIALIASWLLPTSVLLKIVGLVLGLKIFVISPVYKKYPKVKAKYDAIARLWNMLPTNENLNQIEQTQGISSGVRSVQELVSEEIRNSPQQEAKEKLILTKFGLSHKERVINGWIGGKRANLLTRGSLLTGHKSGKLYLTTNFLCFEKTNTTSSSDRFKIELSNVQDVGKAKPFQILPGSGMSIEVFMREEKSYLFAAIFNRDEALRDIIETGLSCGLEWALRYNDV